jgi:hypothetical protein
MESMGVRADRRAPTGAGALRIAERTKGKARPHARSRSVHVYRLRRDEDRPMEARMQPARLDHIPLFADLSDEERVDVATALREVTVEAGAELTAQGAHAYELFVIEAGEAEVRKDGEVVWALGPGDVFGEIGLLATGTRTASVIAGWRGRCARRWPSASPGPGSEPPTGG